MGRSGREGQGGKTTTGKKWKGEDGEGEVWNANARKTGRGRGGEWNARGSGRWAKRKGGCELGNGEDEGRSEKKRGMGRASVVGEGANLGTKVAVRACVWGGGVSEGCRRGVGGVWWGAGGVTKRGERATGGV